MASHHKFRAFQSDLLIVKISHEGCFGPYLTILSQLTFDVCVASKNCEKNYYNLLFWNFKVIHVDAFKKLDTSINLCLSLSAIIVFRLDESMAVK